ADVDLCLAGFGKELRILHRRVEGLAQGRDPIGRRVRSGHERARDRGVRGQKRQDLAVEVVAGELREEWNIGQFGDALEPVLYQELVTFGVLVVLPTQKNLRMSNSTPWAPTAWADIMLDMIMCSTVPSRGAIEAM